VKPTIVGRSTVIFRSSSSHILSSIGFIGSTSTVSISANDPIAMARRSP